MNKELEIELGIDDLELSSDIIIKALLNGFYLKADDCEEGVYYVSPEKYLSLDNSVLGKNGAFCMGCNERIVSDDNHCHAFAAVKLGEQVHHLLGGL